MDPFTRLYHRLWSRIWNSMSFVTLGPVNDAGSVQTAQVSVAGTGEVHSAQTVIGVYGVASNPPAGTQGVSLYQGGDRSKGVLIGTNHQGTRPTGQGIGETTLYNGHGINVALTAGGLNINAGGFPITINNGDVKIPANNFEITGNETITGDVTIVGGMTLTGTLAVIGAITINGTVVIAP